MGIARVKARLAPLSLFRQSENGPGRDEDEDEDELDPGLAPSSVLDEGGERLTDWEIRSRRSLCSSSGS